MAALRVMSRALLVPGAGYRQVDGSWRVRVLQRRLVVSGFMPGPVDGRYGPLTMAAVGRFQDAHGLPLTGILSARTLAELIGAGRRPAFTRSAHGHRMPRVGRVRPGHRVPLPGRLPLVHRVPLPGRVPLVHRVPSAGSTSSSAQLPVTGVLMVLAMLGLVTVALSYGRTRARVRSEHASAYHSTRSSPPPLHAQRPVVREVSGERGGGER